MEDHKQKNKQKRNTRKERKPEIMKPAHSKYQFIVYGYLQFHIPPVFFFLHNITAPVSVAAATYKHNSI